MSVAASNPFIDRWTRQGIPWIYITQSKMGFRTLPANTVLQLPIDDFTFKYPEGILLEYTAYFDHPTKVGIRLEQNPNLDISFVPSDVLNESGGRPEVQAYALMPPDIQDGYFGVRICSNWPFIDSMRLHVFNTDDTDHILIKHSYKIAAARKKPSRENLLNIETLERLRLAIELYPKQKREVTTRLHTTLDEWLPKGIKKEILVERSEE